MIIPSKLLRYKDDIAGVWVQKENKAHFKVVKVLGNNGNKSAVEGISENEALLVESANKKALKEGMRVH